MNSVQILIEVQNLYNSQLSRKLCFLVFNSFFVFYLVSCTNSGKEFPVGGNEMITEINRSEKTEFSELEKKVIGKNCLVDNFSDGYEQDLYGRDCIEGKHLVIQTSQEGKPVSVSASLSFDSTQADGLRTEGHPDFITKVYDLEYEILERQGDDRNFPFLKDDFLIKQKQEMEEKFYGSKSTKYNIVFRTEGDFLILYKASKKLEDIPHIERTALQTDEKGDYLKEEGHYMVPFLGYKVEYCRAKSVRDTSTNKKLAYQRPDCRPEWANYDPNKLSVEDKKREEQEGLKSTVYLKVHRDSRSEYIYLTKKDLFPSDYFDGDWFYSEGSIENYTIEGEIAPFSVSLIQFKKLSEGMEFVDSSGTIEEERHKKIHGNLPVVWVDYEMNQKGDGSFRAFGERIKPHRNPIENPYLQVDFKKIKQVSGEVIDLLITPDYFSFVLSIPINVGGINKKIKNKYSFLRRSSISEEGFVPKKWFIKDAEKHFGILSASPQKEKELGETTEGDLYDQERMIRFHTDKKENLIKWYFSKNSTTDPYYLEIAREAIRIYNQAFQILTKGTDKKIKVVLDETERKDLGDTRYNIINLFYAEEIGTASLVRNSILFGIAPSYVNPNTGQVLGATANIILHNLLQQSFYKVKSYTRYEIFQKNKKTEEENKIHVVDFYLRSRIERQCKELIDFIGIQVEKYYKGEISPEEELQDKKLLISCAEKIYRNNVLTLTLHELGHTFGLSHNFKASVDKENYYDSMEEMKQYFPNLSDWVWEEVAYLEGLSKNPKKLFKTSSVMDYLPNMSAFVLPVLGKYDLAALRFLYVGQLETKSGKFIDLNISNNPDKQISLNEMDLPQRKSYLHCLDHIASKRVEAAENFLCISRDYGSNPFEIITYYMESYQREFDNRRYRYDDSFFVQLDRILLDKTTNIVAFLTRWMMLKKLYFQKKGLEGLLKYSVADPSSQENYKSVLANDQDKTAEYSAYYKIKEPTLNFFLDILFMESMKCEVRDSFSRKHLIDLELIRTQFNPEYVEDCYSKSIKDFLAKQGLELISQRGVEDLFQSSYHSSESSKKRVANIFNLREIQQNFLINTNLVNVLLLGIFLDPDFMGKMKERLERRLLEEGDYLSKTDLTFLTGLYSNFISNVNLMNKSFNDQNQKLLLENRRYFEAVRFTKGTRGEDSFFTTVEYPMSKGRTVESLELPFVEWAYEKYQKEVVKDKAKSIDFQSYIVNLPDSVLYNGGDEFIIPFQKGSFIEKVIQKYNMNKQRIKALESLSDRDFMGAIELKRKIEYNRFLLQLLSKATI